MLNITLTEAKGQYLLDAINTHVKTHGLAVAGMGAVLAAELQAAAGEDEPDESPE